MIDSLTAMISCIHYQAKPVLQLVLLDDFPRSLENFSEVLGVVKLGNISHMLTGNDQYVSGGLWIDVVQDNVIFLLQRVLARNLFIDDLAEDAVGISVHL